MNVNLRYNFQNKLIIDSETKYIEIVGFFILRNFFFVATEMIECNYYVMYYNNNKAGQH